jgi:hypothetical protein
MRKAFRVTTVFTGAAVCAATFMPGTEAAAAPTSKARQLEPDTFHMNCPANPTTSAHFYWPAKSHHGPTCVGEKYPPATSLNHVFSAFCAGNNYGYYIADGWTVGFSYGSVKTLNASYIGKAWINGWYGHSTCGWTF